MKEINEMRLYYWELIEELLREQRHDFLNEIQIIYGYIKLNKLDKAIDYINKVSKNAKVCSKLSNLNCIELYLVLFDKFKRVRDLGLNINFEVYSDGEKKDFLDKDIKKAIDSFNKAMDMILDFMYNNSDFEEHIFYIEETPESFIFKVDLAYLKESEHLKEKFKVFQGNIHVEEEYLIYELELD